MTVLLAIEVKTVPAQLQEWSSFPLFVLFCCFVFCFSGFLFGGGCYFWFGGFLFVCFCVFEMGSQAGRWWRKCSLAVSLYRPDGLDGFELTVTHLPQLSE